jgi:hypothetical protein
MGGVLVTAVEIRMWKPILGLFAVSLVLLLRRWIKVRRLKSLKERITISKQEPDFNSEKFLEIVSKIHWKPISTEEKKKF